MANFLVRVELHEGDGEDYETLHAAMEESGFARTLMVNAIEKKLPPAEYMMRSAAKDKKAVWKLADTAAARTGLRRGVVVAEYVGQLWVGGLEDAD